MAASRGDSRGLASVRIPESGRGRGGGGGRIDVDEDEAGGGNDGKISKEDGGDEEEGAAPTTPPITVDRLLAWVESYVVRLRERAANGTSPSASGNGAGSVTEMRFRLHLYKSRA
eukprot:CAMPEP_0183326346 /NCGR_PEP_ID=MMETSP0160_2-20130417/81942_1 /TAXON_ID=2839 ORGANISM="Odontella Sinensis, Strain Grunow 1884" /NCGR_SAMPLE_ID=MMETSP0160_2 /ASSEMBLY_ACC=CAM_ASM_000250 /LENGTH=114 /DNA_ID=CAMNT_0025494307 /DNA_START=36 /DNA_END=377 /DNA_ORIENTATION=-